MTIRLNLNRYRSRIAAPGLHLAYRLVLRDQATWRDVRGVFIATRTHTYWLTFGEI